MAKRKLKKKKKTYTWEQRLQAVRRFEDIRDEHDSKWSAIKLVAKSVGCAPETLRKWVRDMPTKVSPPDTIDTTFDEPQTSFSQIRGDEIRQLKTEISVLQYKIKHERKKVERLTKERRTLLTIVRDFIDRELKSDSPLAQASYHSS